MKSAEELRFVMAWIWLILVTVLANPSLAQETRSTIYGRVLDPQSTLIARASVTVSNVETGVSITITTNETGYFEAPLLLPGKYRVSVEMPGYKKSVKDGIVLPVSTRSEINFRLELGEVAESVTVAAEHPLLDTSNVS
jgi:Carboxypeptidase regulatory-like domain